MLANAPDDDTTTRLPAVNGVVEATPPLPAQVTESVTVPVLFAAVTHPAPVNDVTPVFVVVVLPPELDTEIPVPPVKVCAAFELPLTEVTAAVRYPGVFTKFITPFELTLMSVPLE